MSDASCPRCGKMTYRLNSIGERFCTSCGYSTTRRGTENVDMDWGDRMKYYNPEIILLKVIVIPFLIIVIVYLILDWLVI